MNENNTMEYEILRAIVSARARAMAKAIDILDALTYELDEIEHDHILNKIEEVIKTLMDYEDA